MFTSEDRDRLRSELLEYAANDRRIGGAAITGSAAAAREDRWSDIDIAVGVSDAAELQSVLSDWTAYLYNQHLALHHFDLKSGMWIYRVFLLPSTLQVDIAFVPSVEFRALAPTFRIVLGEANEPRHAPPPRSTDIIGLAWLYALHARSSIARRNFWQAEYMISGVRDNALALACACRGLPAVHGRGLHLLPNEVTSQFEASFVRHLDGAELSRAFGVVIQGLLAEIRFADKSLAGRLERVLTSLTEIPS